MYTFFRPPLGAIAWPHERCHECWKDSHSGVRLSPQGVPLYCNAARFPTHARVSALEASPSHVAPARQDSQRLGFTPGFDARKATDTETFERLALLSREARGDGRGKATRSRGRMHDAAVMCEALSLDHETSEAIKHHVAALCERADLRRLSKSRRKPRAGAFTIATVALVCERFGVACELSYLFECVEEVTPEDYRVALSGARDWFAINLWRENRETV